MTIPLIDSQDGFEAVRAAMGNILATESASQVALATAAGKATPSDWNIDVYIERNNAWELFRDENYRDSLVANIIYESSNSVNGESTQANQVVTSRILVECIAAAVSEKTASGHTSGDSNAFKRAHMIARLCRRILMHPDYRQLGLTSVVRTRNMVTRRSYQPNSTTIPTPHIAGTVLQFDVKHNETFDFNDLSNAEGALVTIKHDPDGIVIAQMEYDWT